MDNADLDPHIIAQSIATGIENGVNFKRLGNTALERVMNAGAVGCEIVLAGKFSGKRSRKERFVAGYVKKSGAPAETDVDKGFALAHPRLGSTGVCVRIMKETRKLVHVPARSEPTEPEQAETKEDVHDNHAQEKENP